MTALVLVSSVWAWWCGV